MDHLERPSFKGHNQGSTRMRRSKSPGVIGPDVTTDANEVRLGTIFVWHATEAAPQRHP